MVGVVSASALGSKKVQTLVILTAWNKINGGCGFGVRFGEQKCTGEVLQGTLSVSVVRSSEASASRRFLMY